MIQISPLVELTSPKYYIMIHEHGDTRVFPDPYYHASTFFSYLDWSNNDKPTRAEVCGDKFYIYEHGKREHCRLVDSIHFLGRKGIKKSATVKNRIFTISTPIKDSNDAHTVENMEQEQASRGEKNDYIEYLNWDRELVRTTFAIWDDR